LALVGLFVLGCKVGKETTVNGFDKRWDQLSKGDKTTYMIEVVEPQMRKEFQRHFPERFADFGCPTCHGAGADDGTYAMPNPNLPHLRQAGFYREHRKASPQITKFMWNDVDKSMAEMLGKTAGHAGEFDCRSCHIIDDAKH
jgi:hypothetical protein